MLFLDDARLPVDDARGTHGRVHSGHRCRPVAGVLSRCATACIIGVILLGATACRSASRPVVITSTSPLRSTGRSGSTLVANATIVHISDGDTIDVQLGKKRERVRLLGIDTPESVKPNTPVQCFAKDASAYMTATLPIGTAVRLERDIEPRDAYDRLLAYVYRADDGLFINLALARGGYARTLSINPNVAHADELASAVAQATATGIGLWSACPSFGAPASAQRHTAAAQPGPSVPVTAIAGRTG